MKLKTLATIVATIFSMICYAQPTLNCSLTISKGKMIKEKGKEPCWLIPMSFTNNGDDTLRYFSMSCSWQDFYQVDNQRLLVAITPCDKNVPVIITLAPKESKKMEFVLWFSQYMDDSEVEFKIGFNLAQASASQKALDFNVYEQAAKKKLIWSNAISMRR